VSDAPTPGMEDVFQQIEQRFREECREPFDAATARRATWLFNATLGALDSKGAPKHRSAWDDEPQFRHHMRELASCMGLEVEILRDGYPLTVQLLHDAVLAVLRRSLDDECGPMAPSTTDRRCVPVTRSEPEAERLVKLRSVLKQLAPPVCFGVVRGHVTPP
jgi:hypothetical protein